jgi:hypothetical protein
MVCGHWSTLGLTMRTNLIGLDTGCGRGGKLTAVGLEDRAVYRRISHGINNLFLRYDATRLLRTNDSEEPV